MIIGANRWLAGLLLALLWTAAPAHEDHLLRIIDSGPTPQVIGREVRAVAELWHDDDGGPPVAGERLYVSADFGTPAADEFITDGNGQAIISVGSRTAGAGTVTVTDKDGNSASFDIEFVDPPGQVIVLRSEFPALVENGRTKIYVQFLDNNLDPKAGEEIELSVPSTSDGTLSESLLTTDASGTASTDFKAGASLPDGKILTVRAVWATDSDHGAEIDLVAMSPSDEQLRIVRPVGSTGQPTRIEPNAEQEVELLWLRRGLPVRNQTVEFGSGLGSFNGATVETNAAGIARSVLTHTGAGESEVGGTALSGALVAPAVNVVFGPPIEADDVYEVESRSVPLDILKDRIGFQAKTGVTADQVEAIAAAEQLTFIRSFNPRIYEYQVASTRSRDSLHARALRLEALYRDRIKAAGVVVQKKGGQYPMIMTNRILTRFTGGITLDQARQRLLAAYPEKLDDVRYAQGTTSRHEIVVKADAAWDILRIAKDDIPLVVDVAYAQPEFIVPTSPRAFTPDPLLKDQWHHENLGAGVALRDADLDSMEAWRRTTGGTDGPVIAVIDSGFKIDHADLAANLGTGQYAPKDFFDYDDSSLLNPPAYTSHGTAVAGIVGAVADNEWGGRGVCPDCKLLLLRSEGAMAGAAAIDHARENGVRVISNSWGLLTDEGLPVVLDAINMAADANIVQLFAMPNASVDDCALPKELSRLDKVIAVSGATDQDLRNKTGIGNCMDILGPTRDGYEGITTTGIYRYSGITYDFYLDNFGGTSAATPMAAGVVGLMLDLRPGLTRHQVQRALQDTADRIDPKHGEYDPETGFSQPLNSVSTHGYGRVNALAAVALVADIDDTATTLGARGQNGKDLMMRDHALDWGNVPSNVIFNYPREDITLQQSVDIKIDVWPFEPQPVDSADEFAAFVSEEPVIGERMNVYVRVRNRGPDAVGEARLKLHWTLADPPPKLPADFWSQFPADSTAPGGPLSWNVAGDKTLKEILYSGPSIAGCPNRVEPKCHPLSDGPTVPAMDAARIETFSLTDLGTADNQRLTLLAVIHSEEDSALAKTQFPVPGNVLDIQDAARYDNNVTIWADVDPPAQCSPLIITIIIILIIALLLLVAYVIYLWITGQAVPLAIYITIVVLVAILIVIAIAQTGCVCEAIEQLLSAFGL